MTVTGSSSYPQAAYGGKAECDRCGSVIHAGIIRWDTATWARCICSECHEQGSEPGPPAGTNA